mmetsp:Transcript_25687/g.46397  ORF Transcript_25687/g.46397 Transcript_25687/m.46397 type:complete len:80 (-) Transcript_25687:123-362(-)
MVNLKAHEFSHEMKASFLDKNIGSKPNIFQPVLKFSPLATPDYYFRWFNQFLAVFWKVEGLQTVSDPPKMISSNILPTS